MGQSAIFAKVEARSAFAPPSVSGAIAERRACANCLAREFSLCSGFDDRQKHASRLEALSGRDSFHRIAARRTITHPRENSDAVAFICSGWAVSAMALAGGGRQITAILLPGDVISAADLVAPLRGRSVEAVTDVVYRKFKLGDLRTVLRDRPDLMFRILTALARERDAADQLALDLGRRTSEQRIARLILALHARLADLDMVRGVRMDFPLRQRQIADATGLTPVHVCKVLRALTDDGYLRIEDRSLALLDPSGLQQIAA